MLFRSCLRGRDALDEHGAEPVAAAGHVLGGQVQVGDRGLGAGDGDAAELVLLLHPVREAQFFAALDQIKALPAVQGDPAVIRVEGDA